jgi:hypothetical protein
MRWRRCGPPCSTCPRSGPTCRCVCSCLCGVCGHV